MYSEGWSFNMNSFYQIIKKCFDFICSIIGILVSSPIWLVAIIGILISDPGPIFYTADRIGYNNKHFKMYKFRSMRICNTANEKSFKADTDRIFPWGAFIRKTKIDELPQLINLFLGDMSIVGPRPAANDQFDIVRAGKYNIASTVKPGLTGPAALYDYIYGDTIEDPDEYERLVLPTRLELEAYYPAKMSLWYDIKMIWYTIVCILASITNRNPNKIYAELVDAVKDNILIETNKEKVYEIR